MSGNGAGDPKPWRGTSQVTASRRTGTVGLWTVTDPLGVPPRRPAAEERGLPRPLRTPPTPPPGFVHMNQTGAVGQGEMKVFQLPMPAGKKVIVRTTSTKDVDLYVQWGAAPTTSSYVNRGYTSSGNETVTFTATSNGTLFIGVHGYQAGNFSLRTADQ